MLRHVAEDIVQISYKQRVALDGVIVIFVSIDNTME